ncbi:phasin [Methylobacterium sp. 4-46]|uniref:phasin n=1 Tax=unclassified Methylobacterium TaxID=2615210 RepID=UPI000152CB9D|nr:MULTISPECIES: phasin [Methylobacterium]ACA17359.1 phasin [Methylobacterium sp. 4-46]WFT83046.1 phasin [Methylobacterium nodulans]
MNTTPNYEIPAEMRDFAEKSVDQARKAFDSFISAARKTADTIQGSAEVARTNAQTMSTRSFAFAEQNVNAAFDLAQKLVRSRDVQEAMQHQAEFLRSQFAAIQSQAKEFGSMTQSAMQQSAENAKAAMQQGVDAAKSATNDVTHNAS